MECANAELPDVLCYVDALNDAIGGHEIVGVSVRSPFVVRTPEPLDQVFGKTVGPFGRLGKRIVWSLEDDVHLVVHLMVTGRFHWKGVGTKPIRKTDLLAFHFKHGTLLMTEAGANKRASLHIVHGETALAPFDLHGLGPLDCTEENFRVRLASENHTLKRVLTDPRMLSGIGNAYSDEILHASRLSPFRTTSHLNEEEWARLYRSVQTVLATWIDQLAFRGAFPRRVYGESCRDCESKVQRIAYVDGEMNASWMARY